MRNPLFTAESHQVDAGASVQLRPGKMQIIALVAGRLIQTWAMWSTEVAGPARGVGQTLAWLSIALLALLNLTKVF